MDSSGAVGSTDPGSSLLEIGAHARHQRIRSPASAGGVVALVLGWLAIALKWEGGDWPAQLYRVDLFRRVGFTQWDNQWYGGHHTPGYSLLFPPLGALFGPGPVAVVSAVLATWCFARLAARALPSATLASVVFGVGTVTNIAVGRLTFGLGMAIGLAAVLAMVTERKTLAVVLAALSSFGSPVAGLFVALAGTAWWLAERPRRRLGSWVTFGALLPIAGLTVVFPEGGRFPFSVEDALITIAIGIAAAVLLPARYRSLRLGGALYAIATLAVLVVPNPVGANVTRLAIYAGPPVALGALWRSRRTVALAVALPILVWQWSPALDPIFVAGRDPSSDSSYYRGLLAQLASLPPSRVEIPFTKHHWEANYVAPHAALARGWERQLDLDVNALFYDDETALTATAYDAWLRANAVGYVALPDAELDDSAVEEAALIRQGSPSLRRVWSDPHWQLFAVVDPTPLVEGPASLAAVDANSFTVSVRAPGDVLVRIRYSSHWDVQGPGCAAPTADGWTLIRFPQPGTWRVRQVVSRWIPFQPDRTDECPPEPP